MASTTDIYDYQEPWRGTFAVSTFLHVALAAGIFGYAAWVGGVHGENWGGSDSEGSAINVNLVSTATIPLPSRPVETQNILANDSPGLSQSVPREAPKPEDTAIPIPDKIRKPKEKLHTQIQDEPLPIEQPTNVVPFGQGGPTNAPLAILKTTTGTGGISMPGGDFGSRYAWYVDGVRRKISENWAQYEIDPTIKNAKRLYVTFDIGRNGDLSNVELSQSSGIPSLDMSAKRALQRIDTFGPLPADYRGNRVSVEFYFDYKR